MCNVVAERMCYPHPCVFLNFLIQYNFRSKNVNDVIEVTTKKKSILAHDIMFPTVYNFLGFHKTPKYFFLPAVETVAF